MRRDGNGNEVRACCVVVNALLRTLTASKVQGLNPVTELMRLLQRSVMPLVDCTRRCQGLSLVNMA